MLKSRYWNVVKLVTSWLFFISQKVVKVVCLYMYPSLSCPHLISITKWCITYTSTHPFTTKCRLLTWHFFRLITTCFVNCSTIWRSKKRLECLKMDFLTVEWPFSTDFSLTIGLVRRFHLDTNDTFTFSIITSSLIWVTIVTSDSDGSWKHHKFTVAVSEFNWSFHQFQSGYKSKSWFDEVYYRSM